MLCRSSKGLKYFIMQEQKLLLSILPLISSEAFKYWEAVKMKWMKVFQNFFFFLLKSLNFVIGNNTISYFP